jgi:hypothetical protein
VAYCSGKNAKAKKRRWRPLSDAPKVLCNAYLHQPPLATLTAISEQERKDINAFIFVATLNLG